MNKHRNFRNKIVVTYSVIFTFLIFVLSFGFYFYSSNLIENNAKANLKDSAAKITEQTDNIVETMNYISIDLLSNPSFVSSVIVRELYDRNNINNYSSLQSAQNNILKLITNYSISKTVYRVNVFDTKNDFYTNIETDSGYQGQSYQNYDTSWLKAASLKKGAYYLVPSHSVEIEEGQNVNVYSLIRSVEGPNGTVGYLEVQNLAKTLDKITSPFRNTSVIIIDSEGRIVYSNISIDKELVDYYDTQSKSGEKSVIRITNPYTYNIEYMAHNKSQFTGWKIVAVQNKDILLSSFEFLRNTVIVVGIFLILITITFVYVFSGILIKPINCLVQYMQDASIKSLTQKVKLDKKFNNINEINLLYDSFEKMRERLNSAICKEVRSHSLQVKAEFNSLQAQINPHFIYNILNVVSSRGLEDNDEEICEICSKISEMLRYTTSTEKEIVTIKDEINHLSNYMNLMKRRFEHKMEYRIEIDDKIYAIPIPKLVIQPLVENTIHHGFEGRSSIEISVKGYVQNGFWRIDIKDNGKGFDENVILDLKKRMKKFQNGMERQDDYEGMSINGMGLINTYARMLIFTDRKFLFEINNNPDGGACISLGGICSNN